MTWAAATENVSWYFARDCPNLCNQLSIPAIRLWSEVYGVTRDDGLSILTGRGWLHRTPAEFQAAILSGCRWYHVAAGDLIQTGDEAIGKLIGLAEGIVDSTTLLGAPATPMMHFSRPVSWFGHLPILADEPIRIRIAARTGVWLAAVPHTSVRRHLRDNPAWWQYMMPLAISYANAAANVAADLLIRDSERRCAAVLLRLAGRRLEGPDDARTVEILLSQDELAAAAACSRNTAGTVMRKLAGRGLIKLGYRDVIIPSPGALRRFVDDT